jgi:hypothetical protein
MVKTVNYGTKKNPTGGMEVFCCVCCMLSGRGLCYEMTTRPEESYRMWCVVVCDHENLVEEEAIARAGMQSQRTNVYGLKFREQSR